jgi:hypothetical protein
LCSFIIVSVISLLQFIAAIPYEVDGILYSADSSIASVNKTASEHYKNKTIIVNSFPERNMSLLTIDGIFIKVTEINGTYYTPVLPYYSYNSLITMARDIIDSVPIKEDP